MARLLLAGANVELLELARELGHEVAAVADPTPREGDWRGLPLHRSDAAAIEAGGFDAVLLAIDSPPARAKAYRVYAEAGIARVSLAAGRVSDSARHGAGVVVQRGAHLSADCVAGDGVRLNYGANVMHESTLGDFVTIAPNAVVLGRVAIGPLSYVGANATILPGLRIGAGCTVGAGAVVTAGVPDGAVVKGNPAA